MSTNIILLMLGIGFAILAIILIIRFLYKQQRNKDDSITLWELGTKRPIQRIGLIVLILGVISAISWFISKQDFAVFFDPDYFPSNRYDHFFYRLYPIFFPLGLLMTWGYFIIDSVFLWISTGKTKIKKVSISKNSIANIVGVIGIVLIMLLTTFGINQYNKQEAYRHFLQECADYECVNAAASEAVTDIQSIETYDDYNPTSSSEEEMGLFAIEYDNNSNKLNTTEGTEKPLPTNEHTLSDSTMDSVLIEQENARKKLLGKNDPLLLEIEDEINKVQNEEEIQSSLSSY